MAGHSRLASQSFDYRTLPALKRRQIAEEAAALRQISGSDVSGVIQIGLRLQRVRAEVGRHGFQRWLTSEFRWSQSVASNYMQVARVFRHLEFPNRFQPSALYLLARRNVPAAVREEAIDRARAGERVTKAVAEAILSRHCTPSRSRPANRIRQVRRYLQSLSRKLTARQLATLADELSRLVERWKSSGHFSPPPPAVEAGQAASRKQIGVPRTPTPRPRSRR